MLFSYIFPEAEFDLVPVVLFLGRADDRKDDQVGKLFLDLGEGVIDDIFLELHLVCIAQHLPFAASAPYFP